MWRLKSKRVISIAIFGWALAIFILCSLPGAEIPNPNWQIPYLDKIVHFGMFFLLAILISLISIWNTSLKFWKLLLIVVLTALGYGGFIEIMQQYYFNRSGEIMDLGADLVGAMLGCCFYPFVRYIKRKRN